MFFARFGLVVAFRMNRDKDAPPLLFPHNVWLRTQGCLNRLLKAFRWRRVGCDPLPFPIGYHRKPHIAEGGRRRGRMARNSRSIAVATADYLQPHSDRCP